MDLVTQDSRTENTRKQRINYLEETYNEEEESEPEEIQQITQMVTDQGLGNNRLMPRQNLQKVR